MPYEVRTPVFEGPLELLAQLITSQQVDIWEVRISDIVEGFLAEVERAGALDLEAATEVVVVAAVLLELKCRRLLPGPAEVEDDEELAGWDERDLLLSRLVEARTFRAAGAVLAGLMEAARRSVPRVAGMEERFAGLAPDILAGVTPERLRQVMLALCAPRPAERIDTSHLSPVTIAVEDVAQALAGRLGREGRATFRELTAGATRLEVAVAFLAILELYKRGAVELEQVVTFGDLHVVWLERGALVAAGAEMEA